MFARVTHFQMKPDSTDDAMAMIEKLKPQILALPGMHQFINAMNSDGHGCVVALVESRATSDANAEAVKALWSSFSDMLAAPPTAEGYDVQVNWTP